jgi:hypothetical protein
MINNQSVVLPVAACQCTKELLNEQNETLGRSRHDHGFDALDVETFTEQINIAQHFEHTALKFVHDVLPRGLGGLGAHFGAGAAGVDLGSMLGGGVMQHIGDLLQGGVGGGVLGTIVGLVMKKK